jgi:PAS domain S-box-containing protein
MEGNIRMLSPIGVKMFGYGNEEQLIGRNVLELLAPQDRERARHNIELLANEICNGSEDYRALRADGSEFIIEVNGDFIRAADGTPASMVLIVRDVTERKLIEGSSAESVGSLRFWQVAKCMIQGDFHHFKVSETVCFT